MTTLKQDSELILKHIREYARIAMNTVIPDDLRAAIAESVHENVYSKYKPTRYRRRDNWGIAGPYANETTKFASVDDLSITITNVAYGNIDFSPYDESGVPADAVEHNGPWHYPLSPNPGPRPFMEPAAEKYVASGMGAKRIVDEVNWYGLNY